MPSAKQLCTCKHEYQDKRYGQQIRVMTLNANETEARCTVCGKTHNVKCKLKGDKNE